MDHNDDFDDPEVLTPEEEFKCAATFFLLCIIGVLMICLQVGVRWWTGSWAGWGWILLGGHLAGMVTLLYFIMPATPFEERPTWKAYLLAIFGGLLSVAAALIAAIGLAVCKGARAGLPFFFRRPQTTPSTAGSSPA